MIELWFQLIEKPIFPLLGLFVGCIMGSFLNVCAHRIPIAKSIVFPSSHCPKCGSSINWFRNIPIFSWIIQKGRAVCCSYIIPIRYFLVELITGVLFGYFFYLSSIDSDFVMLLVRCIFTSFMLAIIVIDYETMLIPDRLSIGGAVTGLILAFTFPEINLDFIQNSWLDHFSSGLDSLIGLIIGSSLLYWIGVLGFLIFGREALGEGDIKLLGCIGAFCGWQGATFAIFGGAFFGTCLLLPVMLCQKLFHFQKEKNDSDCELVWGKEVPFGPFLAAAGLFYFLGGSVYIEPWFEPFFLLIKNQ